MTDAARILKTTTKCHLKQNKHSFYHHIPYYAVIMWTSLYTYYVYFYFFSHILSLIFYAITVSMHPIYKALNKQELFRALDIGH